MRILLVSLIIFLSVNAFAAEEVRLFPGQYAVNPDMTAADIIAAAYEKAGGETWRRPKSLKMKGHAVMYRGGKEVPYDRYEMMRVYADTKGDAHSVDGKVKIQAWADGKTVFIIAFDGEETYDMNGPVEDQSANDRWASNFGFGAIRHALDDGWTQKRLPDDMIDGRPAHFVELTDPSGGTTRFAIAQKDYAILYVGFDTPRGWHERRYSNFFSKPGVNWVQPGRVRLFYDGVKQNEVIWTDFEIGADLSDDMFVVEAGSQ